MLVCVGDTAFGKLKAVADFASTFTPDFDDEEKPCGTMAAVESGVVTTLVVVVEEFKVAQVTGHVTGGVTALTSSA